MAYIEREIEARVEKWLDSREILVIRGPRQSGKTTLLNRIEEMLVKRGVSRDNIHYFTLEDDLLRLKFEANTKEFVGFFMVGKERKYLLIDEIQYAKDIGKRLKLIFDLFGNAKLIVSGSSSFDLTSLGRYLVGRVIFFDLYPFSFSEFLRSKGKNYEELQKKLKVDITGQRIKLEKTVFLDDLNKFLHEYLTFGSYPRIVLENDVGKKKELLKNLFTTYIEKDLVARYGIKYREKAVLLLRTLASSIGNVVNYETLALHAGLKYNEVRIILPLLEDSFVISIVRPFYRNVLNEIRKNPKIYFIDFGLRNHLLERFEQLDFDHLYENYVLTELQRSQKVRYWRTTAKTEVDFVVVQKAMPLPVEVKTTPKITRSFTSFIEHYHPDKAFIANLNETGRKNIKECTIFMVPFVYL